MAKLDEQGTLTGLFGETKPDYIVQADFDTKRLKTEEDSRLQGLKSGSTESILKSSAAASKEAQDKSQDRSDKRAKDTADDLWLLSLLQAEIEAIKKEIGFLEEQIQKLSETIDGLADGSISLEEALEQPHVQRAITEWEQRNPGQSFDAEAENAEAKLSAIMYEQREIDRGKVSDLQVKQAEHEKRVDEIQQTANTDLETARNENKALSQSGYDAAETSGNRIETDVLKAESSDGQNDHRDVKLSDGSSTKANEDGFGAMVSQELNMQFETASAMPQPDTKPEPTPDVTPDFKMNG